jgi:ubiquinone/menaquinone biosynthesis C-methylase UbiE
MNPWSVFWRQGHSTTFGEYFRQGYEGAVADWWRAELEGMAGGLAVIEIACGNCSLLPAMVRTGRGGRYIGVDLADVELSKVAAEGLEESGIEVVVHSRTPAEELPEPDDSVDLAASVFGIEYSDMGRSIPEVRRVLKSGGRLCALVHHSESVVTRMSKRALGEYHSGDVRKTLEALSTISRERERSPSLQALQTNARAEKSRARINALAQKYLSDRNPATANATMFEFMTSALKFFRMIGAPEADRRRFIASLEAEHKASHERFRQMVSVALDPEGIESLQGRFREAGFTDVESDVAYTKEEILAWRLSAVST